MEANTAHGAAGHGSVHAHERTDAALHSVGILGGVFVLLLVFGVVVGYFVFRFLNSPESLGPPASALSTSRTLPPEPRLQVNAHEDLMDYQKRQQEILNSYGWIDPKAGVVRIPIDQAMDELLKKGLPVRSSAQAGGGATAAKPRAPAGPGKPASSPAPQAPPAQGAS